MSKKEITQEMIDSLNNELNDSVIMCKLRPDNFGPTVDFVLKNETRISSYIINLEEDTHKMIENFFEKQGIKIMYNNTRSCFWASLSD